MSVSESELDSESSPRVNLISTSWGSKGTVGISILECMDVGEEEELVVALVVSQLVFAALHCLFLLLSQFKVKAVDDDGSASDPGLEKEHNNEVDSVSDDDADGFSVVKAHFGSCWWWRSLISQEDEVKDEVE